MLLCFVLLASVTSTEQAEAGQLVIRLREHFDVSQIRWGNTGVHQNYFGATNTINVWWDEPGDWALGLAFNPVLSGGYEAIGSQSPRVDDQVKLLHVGIEGKKVLWKSRFEDRSGPFARGGIYASYLSNVSDRFGGSRWGGSYYVGLGWEFPLFDGRVGLAPDVGFRHSILAKDTQVLSFTPSISVSLYFISDWLAGD